MLFSFRVARWGGGRVGGGDFAPGESPLRRLNLAGGRSPATGRRAGPASGAGQPQPSTPSRVLRVTWTRGRLSEGRVPGEREPTPSPHPGAGGAWRDREARVVRSRKLRSGPGSLPAAAREGPAAGVGRCRGRPAPLRRFAAGEGWEGPRAVLPFPAPGASGLAMASAAACRLASLPCRHRRVRDAAPAGRSGERAGAVRVGRALAGGAGRSALLACLRGAAVGGGYLVDPASSICLSQSLSHACLSTHGRYSETANGSLNQLWFLWSLLSRSLDNCGNSRANTCRRAPTSGDACIYQTKTNPGPPGSFGDSR